MKLICEEEKIDRLFISRIFLYFTDFKHISKTKQALNKTIHKAESLLTGKTDPFKDITSGAIGEWSEITCHPKSDEIKKVNENYSNLIDCGILIKTTTEKILPAFIAQNNFGFHIFNNVFFINTEDLEYYAQRHQFIEIE